MDYGADVEGIDFEEQRLTFAKRLFPELNYRLISMDATDLQYRDEEFDIVVSITVLQHIPSKKKLQAISEISRVVKRGGYIIILELRDLFDDAPHVFPWGLSKWIREFEKRGNVVVKKRGFEYIPILRLLRLFRFKISKRKFAPRDKYGKIQFSKFTWIALFVLMIVSYPIEYLLSSLGWTTWARHVAILFKKQ